LVAFASDLHRRAILFEVSMKITDIRIGARHRKDLGDIEPLARSIAEIGLLHPVVVTPDGLLIAGERRLAACKWLGWADVPVTVVNLEAVVRGESAENALRKDFTPTEAEAIWASLESYQGQRLRTNLERSERRIERAAEATGYSPATLSKVRSVVDAARAEPEKYGDLAEQMDASGKVDRAFRELHTREIASRPRVALPSGVYSVVYADPPWAFANSGFAQSAAAIYPTMPTADICALPIPPLCASDAVLFLWVPNALLPDGLAVMAAWGFEYKSNMVWCKERAPGIGWFTESRHELLFIGTRGTMHPDWKPVSWQAAPQGAHSAKPAEFYALIEQMFPERARIELFARARRGGWEAWGNEV
jgi:ParB/RepB/Spo0J family partition protein